MCTACGVVIFTIVCHSPHSAAAVHITVYRVAVAFDYLVNGASWKVQEVASLQNNIQNWGANLTLGEIVWNHHHNVSLNSQQTYRLYFLATEYSKQAKSDNLRLSPLSSEASLISLPCIKMYNFEYIWACSLYVDQNIKIWSSVCIDWHLHTCLICFVCLFSKDRKGRKKSKERKMHHTLLSSSAEISNQNILRTRCNQPWTQNYSKKSKTHCLRTWAMSLHHFWNTKINTMTSRS